MTVAIGGQGTRVLERSGLPGLWARQFPPLRDEGRRRLAVGHVAATLRTLELPYRIAFGVALRATALLSRWAGPGGTGAPWWTRLPVIAEVYRVTTTLALYGALDGNRPLRRK
ncbi:hypothetical protein [Amycolatopsis sp. NPDC059021]|uniref:hypothetical protein n=1 Tax=Amycolatopsis sp. NPDC059021 TaxID=3346704 RepID=UPI00366C01DD